VFTKQSIIRKTIEVGGSTMVSRLLGLVREVLMANYLGAGPIAEAFITAFKIPNSLRKIFAEGALSVSFIPTFVKIVKTDEKDQVNKLMTLALLLFEGILLLFCLLIIWKAETVIRFIAPGWYELPIMPSEGTIGISFVDAFLARMTSFFADGKPIEQVTYAVTFLRILMGFILFLSTSALLAGALQAVNHFFVPAFSPVLLNIAFITGLFVCMSFGLSPVYLCLFIMAGGLIQLVMHITVYWRLGFSLRWFDERTWQIFKEVWAKFLPCLFSMSVMELYLFVDTSLGSYLPGSIPLIYYANRFMQIPLGVIATALSTILLPHFARIGTYAPKRLGFYLLESAKLIFWIMIPVSLMMGFVSEKIFHTLFLSKKFTLLQVQETGTVLIAFLFGLCFFSLNKILLNMFYALHETKIPMYISLIALVVNFSFSYGLMFVWGAYGIALATTISAIIQTLLFVGFLHYRFSFVFYFKAFAEFIVCFALQIFGLTTLFISLYWVLQHLIALLPKVLANFLLFKIGFWLWFVPLAATIFLAMFKTRKLFGIHLYFLS
jgi:putative peptidoglycan lipid II flippase